MAIDSSETYESDILSSVAPVLLAFLVLGAAIALLLHFTPHSTATAAVTHTQSYASHIVFKSDSIVVGSDHPEDALYVLATVTMTDNLKLPLFIKDFTATLEPAQGEPITTSAPEKPDLPYIYLTFPPLKTLANSAPPPLYRETTIAPAQTVTGTVMLHFPVTQATWDQRKSATLHIDLYHQAPISIPIPKP